MYKQFLSSVVLLLLSTATIIAKKPLNPIRFGLNDAKTAVERYEVLYETHQTAKMTNAPVSYKGIDSIEIEIPKGAHSLPLTDKTDFAGARIYVTNNTEDLFLFDLSQESKDIDVTGQQVDSGVFTDIPQLIKGWNLVIVKDQTPWVKQRIGYKYGAIRRDILLIKNGKARNRAVSPYNNEWSSVKASYCSVTKKKKTISNLSLHRNPGNKKMAFLVSITNQNNVTLSNIEVFTPEDNLVNDDIISISNCTNIYFDNVTINGTYSRKNYSGYGIEMNNVWNCSFDRLRGYGNWGIFGNNNINKAKLVNCDINRFDIHCYGRDISFDKCIFRDLYNQFSSIFGRVTFTDCEFVNFIPVSIETSYNAYTVFDIVVNNCRVKDSQGKNYFIRMGDTKNLPKTEDRPELKNKEWPNFYINGLLIESEGEPDYRLSNYSKKGIKDLEDAIPSHKVIEGVRFSAE